MQGQTGFASPVNYTSGIDHSYEVHDNYLNDAVPAFQFRRRCGDINWRKLSLIDVEKIARELDFVSLQENISTVTFCNIDAVPDVDPLFSKLFKMAQYIIEYLLHSQEYLQSVIGESEAKIEKAVKENEALQTKISQVEDEMMKVKQENKKRRKMIQQQQMLIEAGASSYYQCPHCEKAFMNASFLQGHMQRRHPGSVNYIGDVIAHSQKEQNKLSVHLKQLESDLQTEREDFNRKLLKAEDEKLRWAEQSKRDMDEWKMREEARWKEELSLMKDNFISDIDKLKAREEDYQKKITEMQRTMDVGHSNLGELVDDLQVEKNKLEEYEDRVASLEQMNNAKNRKIEELTETMRQMRRDQQMSLQDQEDHILREHEKKMKQLMAQMKKSDASDTKVAKLQRQLNKLNKKQTQPKQLFISDDDSDVPPASNNAERRRQIESMVDPIREQLQVLLEEKLKDCGVDPRAPGLSSAMLTRKLMVLKTGRQQTAKKIDGYYQMREESRRTMEDNVKKTLIGKNASGRRKKKKSPSTPKKTRSSSSGITRSRMAQSSPKTKKSPKLQRSPVSHRTHHQPDPSPSKVAASPRMTPALQGQSSSSQVASTPSETVQPVAKQRSVVTQQAPAPAPRSAQAKDDGSPWDDSDAVDDILTSDEKATPRGVKDLKKTIEDQMSNRKRPPTGAVDVLPKQNTQVEELNLSDEDSFLVSSLEENNEPVAQPTNVRASVGGGRSAASNSSNTFGTSVWGSGQKKSKDDESSEWDSDIDELLT